jgi:hypothetical protein
MTNKDPECLSNNESASIFFGKLHLTKRQQQLNIKSTRNFRLFCYTLRENSLSE